MKDMKLQAKKDALMGMSSKIKDEARSPLKDELGKKKMSVTVVAPDEKSLQKGLSKAEEILKAKFGKLGLDEESMEEAEEGSEDSCPICGDSLEDMHEHEESEEDEELE